MSGATSIAIGAAISVPLGCYALRRLVLAVAALLPARPYPGSGGELPSLAILVPAKNEAATIGPTLEALDATDYPRDRLKIVLIDDASDDGTGALFEAWAADRPHAVALGVQGDPGKAEGLNHAIATVAGTELVAICDADVRPHPDCFRRTAEVFADPSVAAAACYLVPANAAATPISHYAAVETWVHQLVTSAGKDRLDLNPPTLGGACAYRRSALEGIDGFAPARPGEDVESTVALTWAGWRTRFVPHARADNIVVHAWRDYWRQHIRWARGLFDTAKRGSRRGRTKQDVSFSRRAELLIQSTGYADRLALLCAAGLAGGGVISAWIPVAYVATILPGVLVALVKGGARLRIPLYLAWTVAFFALDILASVAAVLAHLRREPRLWFQAHRGPNVTPNDAGS